MRSKGAEHALDDLIGPQHAFSVKKHVDHVQDPGCQESQEANQEVGNVEASQCFHLILHDKWEWVTMVTWNQMHGTGECQQWSYHKQATLQHALALLHVSVFLWWQAMQVFVCKQAQQGWKSPFHEQEPSSTWKPAHWRIQASEQHKTQKQSLMTHVEEEV